MTETLIEVKNLTKVFGRRPEKALSLLKGDIKKAELLEQHGYSLGLRDISLSINKGEIFVIMGLSGSGKSTLLRHFNRLIEPTLGSIIVGGQDVMALNKSQLREFRQQRMSMVFQRFALFPHYSVLDNVAFGLKAQGVAKSIRHQKASQWLCDVGLEGYASQYPAQLSGGQQQRVGLARALCTDADIMLMDEAFSALDPLIRSEMQDQLIELQNRLKKTIVFITHDLDEALRLGNRIAILRAGELIQLGTPTDIVSNPADDYVAKFVSNVNRTHALTAQQ